MSGSPRHGEGRFGQIHGQPMAHRPADHEARIQIEGHGQVEPAFCGPHVGEVSGLYRFGCVTVNWRLRVFSATDNR